MYYINFGMTVFIFFLIGSPQVIDLTSVSPELAFMASDADLVVLEGMVGYPPFFSLVFQFYRCYFAVLICYFLS
jgi:hypothetical protein